MDARHILAYVAVGLIMIAVSAVILFWEPSVPADGDDDEIDEYAGATEAWSPHDDVVQASTDEAEMRAAADRERRELATAQAELHAMINETRLALGDALDVFRIRTAALMERANGWHRAAGRDHCDVCRGLANHEIDEDQEGHLFLRAFREDTPTGEYRMVPA